MMQSLKETFEKEASMQQNLDLNKY